MFAFLFVVFILIPLWIDWTLIQDCPNLWITAIVLAICLPINIICGIRRLNKEDEELKKAHQEFADAHESSSTQNKKFKIGED